MLLVILSHPGRASGSPMRETHKMHTSRQSTIRLFLVAVGALALAGLMTPVSATPSPLPAPNWAAIFSPSGKVLDLQGGADAIFLEDRISDGVGIDISVLPNPTNRTLVNNGVAARAHDLGNGYVWATHDSSGGLLLYAGVERFATAEDTAVEFEFNQGVVQARPGAPWRIAGTRSEGDLLVRVNFQGGAISSAEYLRWDGSGFWTLLATGPDSCGGATYRACAGAPPQMTDAQQVWDAANHVLAVPQPDAFVEIGVDVASLLGSNVEFTSIQVRTPQDVILDSMRHFGFWAHQGQGGTN